MEEVFNSNLYHWICFIIHCIELFTLIFLPLLLYRHLKITKHEIKIIDGGCDGDSDEQKKFYKYSKTRLYKILEKIRKLFH